MGMISTSAKTLTATLFTTLALGATGHASPLHIPDDEAARALHCAAVLQAYGHAYEFATALLGRPAVSVAQLPEPLVQLAGGAARLPDIALAAEAYQDHAESVARTSFYPSLMGDGTPYLADDGRELVMAVQTCVAEFGR